MGDVGIDGRIFPVGAAPTKAAAPKGKTPAFAEFLDQWYPIQVKQKDKAGRPGIDAFEAVMTREDRSGRRVQTVESAHSFPAGQCR